MYLSTLPRAASLNAPRLPAPPSKSPVAFTKRLEVDGSAVGTSSEGSSATGILSGVAANPVTHLSKDCVIAMYVLKNISLFFSKNTFYTVELSFDDSVSIQEFSSEIVRILDVIRTSYTDVFKDESDIDLLVCTFILMDRYICLLSNKTPESKQVLKYPARSVINLFFVAHVVAIIYHLEDEQCYSCGMYFDEVYGLSNSGMRMPIKKIQFENILLNFLKDINYKINVGMGEHFNWISRLKSVQNTKINHCRRVHECRF